MPDNNPSKLAFATDTISVDTKEREAHLVTWVDLVEREALVYQEGSREVSEIFKGVSDEFEGDFGGKYCN